MLSKYSFPKTLKEIYIDFDIIGEIRPNTEYALYITCDPATITNNCWCGFITSGIGWCSNTFYYGDKRCIILKTDENVTNNSKLRLRGDKGLIIKHARLIELVTNSKYSRIERFLYALYSLESSDLPTPLSRIEELYKCWVTGEEPPTFEPLSRVEKYLMAILGAYDVDSLPNPISRVEVLLYKLTTGDDNLDDVKSFLSEHEELLAEIIRNGSAGGNIDIEYVLYTLSTEFNTLYNTAEKPVKSAILKGQTLVNITKPIEFDATITTTGLQHLESYYGIYNIIPTTDKQYLVCCYIHENKIGTFSLNRTGYYDDITLSSKSNITQTSGVVKYIATCNGDGKTLFTIGSDENAVAGRLHITCMVLEYREGMENWDIPYFEGMQSVKMPVLTTINGGEPFKSNILTVNEDVTLRSNGDVYDELNLLTGRLTQRIDENNEVLSQEVVKTVDLSVVDQDGNDTELSTFDDITHVTLSSEGFIPEAELEVATKNEEVLNTMSLEMDDISKTQKDLQETLDTQSENVDSTMIATTEIYEGLL